MFFWLYNLAWKEVSPYKFCAFKDCYVIWQLFSFRILLGSTGTLGSSRVGQVRWLGLCTAHYTDYGCCESFHTKFKARFLCSTLLPFRYVVLQWIGFYGFTSYVCMSFLSKEIIPVQLRRILLKDPRAFVLSQSRFNIPQWLSPFSDSTEPTASWYVYVKCKWGEGRRELKIIFKSLGDVWLVLLCSSPCWKRTRVKPTDLTTAMSVKPAA